MCQPDGTNDGRCFEKKWDTKSSDKYSVLEYIYMCVYTLFIYLTTPQPIFDPPRNKEFFGIQFVHTKKGTSRGTKDANANWKPFICILKSTTCITF